MALPSERGTANVTLFEGGGIPPVMPSERGTANVTLFEPSGPIPIVPSARGTRNVTLFDPPPDAVVFPSARGVANATLVPANGDDSPLRLATRTGSTYTRNWFRTVVWNGAEWIFD